MHQLQKLQVESPSQRGAFFYYKKIYFIYALGLLFGLYVALAPNVDLLPQAGNYDEQRILQIILLLALGLGLLASRFFRHSWLVTYCHLPFSVRIGLAIIFSAGIVSAVLSPSPWHGLLEVSLFVLLFCTTICLATIFRQLKDTGNQIALVVLTVTVCAYLTNFFIEYAFACLEGVAFDALTVRYLFQGFANIRFFGQFQSWTLPLIVLPALMFPVSKNWRWILAGLAMAWWMLALTSGSRGPWLAMLAAGLTIVLFCPRPGTHWLKLQAQAFIGGVALYLLFFLFLPYVFGLQSSAVVTHTLDRLGGLSTRLQLWAHSLDLIAAHPWLGAGPMHFAWYQHPIAAHPHNSILQWAAEWGVPSALLLICIAGWGFWTWIRHIRASSRHDDIEQRTLKVALLASLTAGAAHSMVSGIIVTAYSQILMVFIVAWVFSLYFRESITITAPSSRQHAILVFAVIASSTTLFWTTMPQATNLDEYVAASEGKIPPGRQNPRIWQQGYILNRDRLHADEDY